VACQFALGFGQMRDLVGPSTVGDCLENERQIAGNGNVEQRTSNGLLVFRAIDQRLLFVGANQTWINRDGTIVARPNEERLEWEGDRQLVEALRGGGYNVYFRHGATDASQTDSDPKNLGNCATQRNLTDAGRTQARTIGDAFRTLAIPVNQVLSSEYCRALEYSRLAFNKAEPVPSLVLPDPLTDQEKAQNTEAVKQLLATPPQAGTNTILVAHSPNIRLAAGVDLPVEGTAAVFRVQGQGAPVLLARILPDEWSVLARVLKPR
jgi:phosphohistidine phosphatase SixA